MCVKEFRGYGCGHCSTPKIFHCPLTNQDPVFLACPIQAERCIPDGLYCPACSRIMWNKRILEQENEHRLLHEKGECSYEKCQVAYTEHERERIGQTHSRQKLEMEKMHAIKQAVDKSGQESPKVSRFHGMVVDYTGADEKSGPPIGYQPEPGAQGMLPANTVADNQVRPQGGQGIPQIDGIQPGFQQQQSTPSGYFHGNPNAVVNQITYQQYQAPQGQVGRMDWPRQENQQNQRHTGRGGRGGRRRSRARGRQHNNISNYPSTTQPPNQQSNREFERHEVPQSNPLQLRTKDFAKSMTQDDSEPVQVSPISPTRRRVIHPEEFTGYNISQSAYPVHLTEKLRNGSSSDISGQYPNNASHRSHHHSRGVSHVSNISQKQVLDCQRTAAEQNSRRYKQGVERVEIQAREKQSHGENASTSLKTHIFTPSTAVDANQDPNSISYIEENLPYTKSSPRNGTMSDAGHLDDEELDGDEEEEEEEEEEAEKEAEGSEEIVQARKRSSSLPPSFTSAPFSFLA